MQWYILYSPFMNIAYWPIPLPCFPLCPLSTPLHKWASPFDLLGDHFFGDCGANVHPHLSLVDDRLPTHCSLTLPFPSQQYPQFMLHVYMDDITTSVTLSDTHTPYTSILQVCCISCQPASAYLHLPAHLQGICLYKYFRKKRDKCLRRRENILEL